MSKHETPTPAEEAVNVQTVYRQRRFRRFLLPLIDRIARQKGAVRILDIGGRSEYWRSVEQSLRNLNCVITILNLEKGDGDTNALYRYVEGDAREIKFENGAFDLVHSNSVIEHVGAWKDMVAMARETRRLAPAYYLQTPNFWFPFEPHFRTIGFHWLPEQVRIRLLMRMKLGFRGRAAGVADAMESVESVKLLDRAQLAALLPDATINRERIFGLTKSLIAIRG